MSKTPEQWVQLWKDACYQVLTPAFVLAIQMDVGGAHATEEEQDAAGARMIQDLCGIGKQTMLTMKALGEWRGMDERQRVQTLTVHKFCFPQKYAPFSSRRERAAVGALALEDLRTMRDEARGHGVSDFAMGELVTPESAWGCMGDVDREKVLAAHEAIFPEKYAR